MIFGRPVTARASLIAWSVASEPLPQRRTSSAEGTWRTMRSASATSASVTPSPNRTPPLIASATAWITGG